jgi:poly(3-hydroxybutyrate) depolymerase
MHGRGGSAQDLENYSGFDGLAEANRFLVVYPDGTNPSDGTADAAGTTVTGLATRSPT